MASTGNLELYHSLMKWLRTFSNSPSKEEAAADVTDGVDMAKVSYVKYYVLLITCSTGIVDLGLYDRIRILTVRSKFDLAINKLKFKVFNKLSVV